ALQELAHLVNKQNLYIQYINLNAEHLEEHLINAKLDKLAVFLDLNCNKSDELLHLANMQQLYNDHYHWLIYDRYLNATQLRERFADASLQLNTELTYVKPNLNQSSFMLYDLYNKAKHLGAKLNITIDQQIECNDQQCQVKRYLSELHKTTRLQQRKLLTGLTLKLSAVINALPMDAPEHDIKEFLGSIDNIHLDTYGRFGYQTRQELMTMLDCNFSYIFRDRWTSSELTGGLIADLLNGTVDVAGSAFLYTSGRAKYFKPLTWYCSFRSVCMFRNPHSAGAELRATEFLQPFSWTVWFMFAAVLLLSGCLLWLTFRLERKKLSSSGDMKASLLTSCLISFGAACIQGAWLLPRSTGGRMVFYALMLTCFLMYNYYTSVVVSTLLGTPPKSNIKSIQQLADSNLEVSVEPTPYTKIYVETSDMPDVRSLYLNKIVNSKRDPKRMWLPTEKGVILVRNVPGFVYIAEAATAYVFVRKHYLPHEICELNEILLREETSAQTLVLKTSSFAELFKLNELRLLETGVHFKHYRYWVRTKLHCYQSNVVAAVGMDSAGPLFLLLFCAYMGCLLVLGLELLWHRRKQAH
ncbi:Ir75b, partial [Drosophila busckii]